MTSARTQAIARTRRLNAALVAGAVFASVGIGSAFVGNAVAASQQTSTASGSSSTSSSTTTSTEQSPVKKFFSGLVGGSGSTSSNAPSHATTSGS